MTELRRNLGLTLMMLYGLGTILGAGIYVLTGVVAAEAGQSAPVAFLLAALVAAPTAWSYAALAARFPKSAGEAVYTQEAFNHQWLASAVGAVVVFVGIVSAATISRGFVGYLQVFLAVPDWLVIVTLVTALTLLAAYGVMESVSFAAIIAVVEIVGLLMVVSGGFLQPVWEPVALLPAGGLWAGVLAGAFLAFYAFIGFEDIVNMAEETRRPERVLPIAVLGSLAIASVLYFLVTWVAVATVPIGALADAAAPMALVVERHGVFSPQLVALISMLAVVNGALVQIIMASRVIYGVAGMRAGESWFERVNPTTRTPVNATMIVGVIVLAMALSFDVRALASLTSAATLVIFTVVNLALTRVQSAEQVPAWQQLLPWIAAALCMALLTATML